MPSAYGVRELDVDGQRVVELRDDLRGQTARVLPEVGATCFEYSITHAGEVYHLLDPPPDLALIAARPTQYGTPILYPFPNRIRQGRWSFRGVTYQFADCSKGGNHLHGLVFYRPWKVANAKAGDDGAVCSMALESHDWPDIHEQYPFPFRIAASYSLSGGYLGIRVDVESLGDVPLPMGLGLHPYFRAPISATTPPAACRVTVPARRYWELQDLLPTGRVLPVSGKLDLTHGRAVEGLVLDDVLTDVTRDSNGSRCIIEDEGIGLRTELHSDRVFREMVVYTPPNRPSICIEPYTCPTDCPNLAERGLDAGLIVLEPGETFSGAVRIAAAGY